MAEDAMIRKQNLKLLGKKPGELSALLGKSYSYWRDLMENPEKSFGEKVARDIEDRYPLPRLWLDTVHGEGEPIPRVMRQQPDDGGRSVVMTPETTAEDPTSHIRPIGGVRASIANVGLLSAEDHQLLADLRELLPEDREQFVADIRGRADQMRKHAEMVLRRAGVTAPASDARVSQSIKPAPEWKGPERRSRIESVEIERRASSHLITSEGHSPQRSPLDKPNRPRKGGHR